MANYGSVDKVAELARMWTINGQFTKNPVEETVLGWLEDISAYVDVCLAGQGFTQTPVTNEVAASAIGLFVSGLAADLAHSVNSSGRYAARKIQTSRSVLGIIREDVETWVKAQANALQALGLDRQQTADSIVFYTYTPKRATE